MAARLTFNKKYTKVMVIMTLGVILLYIPLNVIYVVSSIKYKDKHSGQQTVVMQKLPADSNNGPSINLDLAALGEGALSLKNISPESDGSVNLVLNLNLRQLLDLVDASSVKLPPGEMTANPLPHDPKFVINNEDLCKGVPDLQWIIYVHSAPKNTKRRELIRSTWASRLLFKKDITRLVFLMGQTLDEKEKKIVQFEHLKYNDIVMGDFLDHYKNLTLKGIMGLKWVSTYCPNAPYAMKADDDAFVNIFEVMKDLKHHASKKRMIYCPIWKENTMPILRDPKKCMKWCVKSSEFPGRTHFPRYCAGLAFLMTSDITKEMYNASLNTPFFWIDDVYITGLLTAKLKDLEFVNAMEHFTLKEPLALEHYANPTVQEVRYYFVHGKTPEKFEQFWNHTLHRLKPAEISLITDTALERYPDLVRRIATSSLNFVKGKEVNLTKLHVLP